MRKLMTKAMFSLGVILVLFASVSSDTRAVVYNENKSIKNNASFKAESYAGEMKLNEFNKEKEKPQYAPGEVLVGLKEGVDIKEVLQKSNIDVKSVGRIHNIKPVVEKLKKDFKLEKDSDGWYWFMGKQYEEINNIPDERIFQGGYKKMPEAEKRIYRSYKVIISGDISVEEAVAKLKANPGVEYAEPNHIMTLYSALPNDTYMDPDNDGVWSSDSWGQGYEDLWGLKIIEADKAWDTTEGDGVIVAVIDTGVDYNHEDISDNIWMNHGEDSNHDGILDENDIDGIDDDGNGYIDDIRGWDFSGDESLSNSADIIADNDPMDYYGHGTHCAGTIAAIGNNEAGIIGVAPKARIMSLKGFPNATNEVMAEAIKYAADNGAKVLSNSWGPMFWRPSAPTLEAAIDYAYDVMGCVIVFSAGNNNDDVIHYSPANYSKTIAVASTDHEDQKSSFSNFGGLIDVAAPGGDSGDVDGPDGPDTWRLGRNILSLRAADKDMYAYDDVYYGLPEGICLVPQFDSAAKYYRARGTSMAGPHAAGLAALIIGAHPEFSNEEIGYVMRNTADDVEIEGWDSILGYGRINASKAVSLTHVGIVNITTPRNAEFIALDKNNPILQISGTVKTNPSGLVDFYEIYYAPADDSTNWTRIVRDDRVVENDFLGAWDMSNIPLGNYILELRLTDKLGKIFSDHVSIEYGASVPYKEGWPVSLGEYSADPLFVDLNNDGIKEVIAATEEKVYLWNAHAELLQNWPKELITEDSKLIFGPMLSVGNLDEDKDLEIIAVGNKETVDSLGNLLHHGIVYVWNMGGTNVQGWPLEFQDSSLMPVSLVADMNNDGKNEIIFGEITIEEGVIRPPLPPGSTQHILYLHALNGLKEELPGWPIRISESEAQISDLFFSTGYIDSDEYLDIVVLDYIMGEWNSLSGYNHLGQLLADWVFVGDDFYGPPALGDIDKDGKMEIAVGVNGIDANEYTGAFYVLDNNGYPMNFDWPIRLWYVPKECTFCTYSSINTGPAAISDLDNNGDLEIVFIVAVEGEGWESLTLDFVYVYDLKGELMDGWPKEVKSLVQEDNIVPSPTIGDIDGDGSLDVMVGPDRRGFMYAWKSDGTEIEGFPRYFGIPLSGNHTLMDIDNDGILEIGGGGQMISVIEIEEIPFDKNSYMWPMYRYDPSHTGYLPFFLDSDNDGYYDYIDNCLNVYNPDQKDSYPRNGNGIGDACECEGNFDNDLDVDGTDAFNFKKDYGRGPLTNNACTNDRPCNGDFNCNGAVDGTDAAIFKSDYGRSSITKNPCPKRTSSAAWCSY